MFDGFEDFAGDHVRVARQAGAGLQLRGRNAGALQLFHRVGARCARASSAR